MIHVSGTNLLTYINWICDNSSHACFPHLFFLCVRGRMCLKGNGGEKEKENKGVERERASKERDS